jgi:hypothetical protein
MVRLRFEAACTVAGERPRGRLASLHRQLVTLPTNMGVDHIVGITGHVQDHLLTNPYVDLLPARSGLPSIDGDVDGQCVVIDRWGAGQTGRWLWRAMMACWGCRPPPGWRLPEVPP